jgi:hypothetical protein
MVSCFSLSGFGILHRTAVWSPPSPPTGNFRWKLFSPAQLSPTTRVLLIPCQKDFPQVCHQASTYNNKRWKYFSPSCRSGDYSQYVFMPGKHRMFNKPARRKGNLSSSPDSTVMYSCLLRYPAVSICPLPSLEVVIFCRLRWLPPNLHGIFWQGICFGTEPLVSSLSAWPSREQSHLSGLMPGSSPWE